MRRIVYLTALLALVAAAVVLGGISSCSGSHHAKPPTVVNCLLDRDRDCPAGEPDNDGNNG